MGCVPHLGAAAGSARWFGWTQTVATIVFCFALRFRSLEDWKNGLRRDLGVLLGVEHGPSVLTLRTKVKALAESVDPVSFARELLRRYLRLEPVWEGLYYVDGYFCPYYGQHPTPCGWDAKRRLAVKGHTDVYLHDARGRVLFFFSQPLNDSLAHAIPAMVQEIRRVHGSQPFTLVFDRGGYSGDTFRFLQQQNIGFVTYLRGRSARRRYARKRFHRGWFFCEGRRHTYRWFEKKTRLRIGWLPAHHSIPGRRGAADPRAHQLGSHLPRLQGGALPATALAAGEQLQVPRRELRHRTDCPVRGRPGNSGSPGPQPQAQGPATARSALTQQLQALEAQLGRALDDNPESRRRTVRGLKMAHSQLRREIARNGRSCRGWRTVCATPPGGSPPPRSIGPAPCCARTAA